LRRKGIRINHNKHTGTLKPVRIDHCKSVTLPMRQHIGAACEACVAPGEHVLAGQLVGKAEASLSAPVHASISGTVQTPEIIRLPNGEEVKAVVIQSDGEMKHMETLPPEVNSLDEFIQVIRDSGLVGLGGAGFPAHAKLRSAAQAGVNLLLVNAAECEPYVTADHREALDHPNDVAEGVAHIRKWLGIEKSITGGENGRYPHGAEKMLVHALTKRTVPLGKLPIDVGVLVMNISSVAFVGRYMRTGMPLISRTVTVDGGAVPHPMNVRVPIGISIKELCEFCGIENEPAKIILGGPMMGTACPDMNTPVEKSNNCVLLFSAEQAALKPETACIRCGACVSACPMKLQPFKLAQGYAARDAAALDALYAEGCMECGSCSYVCPAGRELVQGIRMGKKVLREAKAKGAAKANG